MPAQLLSSSEVMAAQGFYILFVTGATYQDACMGVCSRDAIWS